MNRRVLQRSHAHQMMVLVTLGRIPQISLLLMMIQLTNFTLRLVHKPTLKVCLKVMML